MRNLIKHSVVLVLVLFIVYVMVTTICEVPRDLGHEKKWANGYEETASKNLVTAIYLDYRLFDTFIEAIILFTSVGGIVFMSKKDTDIT